MRKEMLMMLWTQWMVKVSMAEKFVLLWLNMVDLRINMIPIVVVVVVDVAAEVVVMVVMVVAEGIAVEDLVIVVTTEAIVTEDLLQGEGEVDPDPVHQGDDPDHHHLKDLDHDHHKTTEDQHQEVLLGVQTLQQTNDQSVVQEALVAIEVDRCQDLEVVKNHEEL
jgi:hypothetical protein